jgi:hypothetical protein
MRQVRVHLRTMMVAVVFIALALAVIVQSVRLQQALIREQRFRNEADYQRALTLRQVSPGKEDSFKLETFRREPCG